MMPSASRWSKRFHLIRTPALIALACFIIGAVITMAERTQKYWQPDAGHCRDILMVSVAWALAFSRPLGLRSPVLVGLSRILLVCYGVLFLLTAVPGDFLAVTF